MDTPSIEFGLSPASTPTLAKKRKHDVCKSDDNTVIPIPIPIPIPLRQTSLTDVDSDTVATDDVTMNNTTTLDLTAKKDFGVEDWAALAKTLESFTTTPATKLLLSRVGIGPMGGVAMAELLGGANGNSNGNSDGNTNANVNAHAHQTIVHLDLERNGLGAVGACAMFEALESNTTLLRLNMSLNDIKAATSAGNDTATRAIGNALLHNTTLTELLLVRSGLGPKGGTHLASGLATNRSLLRLDMAGNDIMADGGRALGEALTKNTTLQDLNLRWNRIGCGGDRGILSLADALRVNVGLLKFDVSVNELYSEGAIAFGTALGANRSLLELSLERNEIGVAGAVALGEALRSNTTLQRLVLSGNPGMGDEGAAAIGQSLADHIHSALTDLELVGCGVGIEGARAFGRALQSVGVSLSGLRLERNRIGPEGATALAAGLGENTSLKHLNLSRNGLQEGGGSALALALRTNRTLWSLDISNNDIEVNTNTNPGGSIGDPEEVEIFHIIESIVNHPALREANISSNALEIVPIDCQLRLARLYKTGRHRNIDLSDNPLSSPPLGRRAGVEGLRAYLSMLLSESTAVNRIRLMVLGFGGVGKSTFCDAVTQPNDLLPYFHGSLVPLDEWDSAMIASWAKRLGTHWAPFIASVVEANTITGRDLPKLTILSKGTDGSETYEPSKRLQDLLDERSSEAEADGFTMNPSETKSFARAIGALMRKGYFSTVGAVKLEGLLELNPTSENDDESKSNRNGDCESRPRRKCSLVDFAGQMEYLVSHQLLLSSLHTLCVVLQPAPSFGNPQSRHYGSWMYWSRFLRALGDRRRGSLLLAISQQDKIDTTTRINQARACIEDELAAIRVSIPNITESPPLCLDYRPECIPKTIEDVKGALSGAADVVARDWYVPASYETLAELVRRVEITKKSNREVPIISRQQLRQELRSVGLHQMYEDPQLFRRGIEYLEAVGDVMTDVRLDCLLLDPISWFASFLAHFIRDDDIVTSVQLESRFVERGVVSLEDVVSALQHDYAKPREQVTQIMSLVCRLELCIRYNTSHQNCETNDSVENNVEAQETPLENDNDDDARAGIISHQSICEESNVSYLFPCLLPSATACTLAKHWPAVQKAEAQRSVPLVYRGHRFRSRNGFFPPGLFPGLLARCRLLRSGVLHPKRMWKNCAVLVFGSNTRVLLRIDLSEGENAILDVVGAAPTSEELFVGGAKGQASAVIWMSHLVKMFLRKSYPQLETDEFFLCPWAECHAPNINALHKAATSEEEEKEEEVYRPCRSDYNGTEFPAEPQSGKRYKGDHSCEADGCWSQLGVGHKIERMKPKARSKDGLRCRTCRREALFALRT